MVNNALCSSSAPQLFENKKHGLKVAVYEAWLSRNPALPAYQNEVRIARNFGVSLSSVRRYIKEIDINGYVPRPKMPQGRSVFAWSPEAIVWMKAFYLAAKHEVGGGSKRNAYREVCKEAAIRGWKVGTEQSAYKHLKDVHALLEKYTEGGTRALDNLFYIARDLTHIKPFEIIVGDQHIFDWWVIDDTGKEIRPQCYLWLDMRTRLPYGIAFEQGAYNFRTVARSLRAGVERFGRFKSTYNDNGRPEMSGKIDWLVTTLQTLGMKFTDEAELYKTPDGKYAIEDDNGAVVEIAESCAEWHKRNRRIYAKVKNAKTKPIERFFSTLEQLLLDRCLPGAVINPNASAAEEEKESARLNWQKKNGYLLHYDEFVAHVLDALTMYETRTHSMLKISPRQEMQKAIEMEGWKPSFIEPAQIAYLFMEPHIRKVKNNRVTACGMTFVGPDLTAEMVKSNRGNLAGLDGKKIEVRIDPDNPESGAFAIDPRDKQFIYLTPEIRIDPFDDEQVQSAIAQKKHNIKAVTDAYKAQTAGVVRSGRVLSSSIYKGLEERKKETEKAIEHTASAPDFTNEELNAAVQALLQKEQNATSKPVYSSERDRYDSILDAILDDAPLTQADKEFKIYYEQNMGEEERLFFENKITYGKMKREEVKRWR